MRILVVDDSRTARKVVRVTLEELGDCVHEVLEAEDGLDALELLRNEKLEIDAVLVDWNMPRLDGPGFLKQLRAMGLSREVSVVMITSQAQRENVAEALRWGACDYVVKPFAPEVLHEKIRKVASRVEARRCQDTSVLLKVMAAAGARREELPFLDLLPPDLAAEVRAMATSAFHADGAMIVRPGQKVDALHLLALGEAAVAADGGAPEIRRSGDSIGEEAFLEGTPARSGVRARTAVQVISLSRAQVADLVRRRPEMSYFLGQLVTRGGKTPPAGAVAGLAGRLETLPIGDLVQILHLCRKTGRLHLEASTGPAELFFVEGDLRHATAGGLRGEEAVYRVAAWAEAAFSFESGRRPPRESIAGPTLPLLMEGMRRADEARRSGKRPDPREQGGGGGT